MDFGNIKAAVWQLEKANSGLMHYQMTVQVKEPTTMGKIQKLVGVPNVHVEICKDVEASIRYCSKDDTRVEGPWRHGSFDGRKRKAEVMEMARSGATTREIVERFDLWQNVRAIESLTALYPPSVDRSHRPTVIILTGPSGIGKSTFYHHDLGLESTEICRASFENNAWRFNGITSRTELVLYDEVGRHGINARDFRSYVNYDPAMWPRKSEPAVLCKPRYVVITTNLDEWTEVFGGIQNEGVFGSTATLERISVVATRTSRNEPWSVTYGNIAHLQKVPDRTR